MRSAFFISIILICIFSFAQQNELPSDSTIRYFASLNGQHTIIHKGDSIISTWENGILDGPYIAYYSNGKLKAKGEFKDNMRTGKFLLYSSNGKGKLHISFNKYGSTTVKRAKIPGKGGIRFGRGCVYFKYRHFDMTFSNKNIVSENINGIVHFRRGIKHGEQTEYYENGDLRSIANFKYGMYHGERKIYFHASRLKMETSYKDGKPDGFRKEYTSDGSMLRQIDYRLNPPQAEQFYIDKYDISRSFTINKYVDTSFSTAKLLFFPKDKKSLPDILNEAFIDSRITAYKDEHLLNIHFPDHMHPDLSCLSQDEIKSASFTGFILNNAVVFNQQTWLMYSYPLTLQPVSSLTRDKTVTRTCGARVYLPESKRDIRDKLNFFPLLKSQNYPYIIIPSKTDSKNANSKIESYLEARIKLIEIEHAFWIEIYGLEK